MKDKKNSANGEYKIILSKKREKIYEKGDIKILEAIKPHGFIERVMKECEYCGYKYSGYLVKARNKWKEICGVCAKKIKIKMAKKFGVCIECGKEVIEVKDDNLVKFKCPKCKMWFKADLATTANREEREEKRRRKQLKKFFAKQG